MALPSFIFIFSMCTNETMLGVWVGERVNGGHQPSDNKEHSLRYSFGTLQNNIARHKQTIQIKRKASQVIDKSYIMNDVFMLVFSLEWGDFIKNNLNRKRIRHFVFYIKNVGFVEQLFPQKAHIFVNYIFVYNKPTIYV